MMSDNSMSGNRGGNCILLRRCCAARLPAAGRKHRGHIAPRRLSQTMLRQQRWPLNHNAQHSAACAAHLPHNLRHTLRQLRRLLPLLVVDDKAAQPRRRLGWRSCGGWVGSERAVCFSRAECISSLERQYAPSGSMQPSTCTATQQQQPACVMPNDDAVLNAADLPPPVPPPPPQCQPSAREPHTPASACCRPPAQARGQAPSS